MCGGQQQLLELGELGSGAGGSASMGNSIWATGCQGILHRQSRTVICMTRIA